MFTGLIQAVGQVEMHGGLRLRVTFDPSWMSGDPLQLGESVAVNGVCLTVVEFSETSMDFDLSEETLARTSLGQLNASRRVNLERALKLGDRLGGHWVQGHVDGTGHLVSRQSHEGSDVFQFEVPEEGAKFLIDKGSICIDGISLTVVNPSGRLFETWIIPHTLANTHLVDLQPGSCVNLEYDVVAKYLQHMGAPWFAAR